MTKKMQIQYHIKFILAFCFVLLKAEISAQPLWEPSPVEFLIPKKFEKIDICSFVPLNSLSTRPAYRPSNISEDFTLFSFDVYFELRSISNEKFSKKVIINNYGDNDPNLCYEFLLDDSIRIGILFPGERGIDEYPAFTSSELPTTAGIYIVQSEDNSESQPALEKVHGDNDFYENLKEILNCVEAKYSPNFLMYDYFDPKLNFRGGNTLDSEFQLVLRLEDTLKNELTQDDFRNYSFAITKSLMKYVDRNLPKSNIDDLFQKGNRLSINDVSSFFKDNNIEFDTYHKQYEDYMQMKDALEEECRSLPFSY